MNILYIDHYAGSPSHGMEFRPFYLAREWGSAGHKVLILAASYSHLRYIQPDLVDSPHVDELVNGINYRWYSTPIYKGNGFMRVINILSFIAKVWLSADSIVNDFQPDVVIASSTYPMDIWPARKIAKLARCKLVYEVHDLWPLSPIEIGDMSRFHPFILWVQWAEDYAYKYCDKVVSILPKTLEYMQSRGLKAEKWHYIPNGIVLDEWQIFESLPIFVQEKLNKLKVQELPIVCYAGTHGQANALDVFLDTASHLRGVALLLLVGGGPERNRLLKRVEDENLDNVTMLDAVPKGAIPQLLSQVDFTYIGWHKNSLYRFGISPNKLMDYMMAGKPIIHSVAAGNDPVEESGCGLAVKPEDPTDVATAILSLCQLSRIKRAEMGLKGRQYVMENRLYSKLAADFLNVISSK